MVDIKSTLLKPGDEVKVYAGEIIPRDGLVCVGKAFVDESMMAGESNPVFKEKGDHVIGGTKVASDNMIVEITAEVGRSFRPIFFNDWFDSKCYKTKNPKRNSIDHTSGRAFTHFYHCNWHPAIPCVLSRMKS